MISRPLPHLPPDALGSEALATTLWRIVESEAPCRVILLEGGWGSGKTDVLRRLFELGRGRRAAGAEAGEEGTVPLDAPYLLDPWQERHPDFVGLLAIEMMRRARQEKDRNRLSALIEAIVETGPALLGAAGVVAAGGVGSAVSPALAELFAGLRWGEPERQAATLSPRRPGTKRGSPPLSGPRRANLTRTVEARVRSRRRRKGEESP